MNKEVSINIDPFKMFLGKVLPGEQTEWFIIDNYDKLNITNMLNKYFSFLENTLPMEPNYEQLVHILTLLKTAFARKEPNSESIVKNIKVKKRYKNEYGKQTIDVVYEFE